MPAATSTFARASELAARFFAACPTFIAETTGVPVVHEGDVNLHLVSIYPRPSINVDGQTIHRVKIADGVQEFHLNEGFIMFTIIRNTPATVLGDPDETKRNHSEFFGKVTDEFLAIAGDPAGPETLGILAFDIIEVGDLARTVDDALMEAFICKGRIHWGDQHRGRYN